MASSIQWPGFAASDTPLEVLVKLSRFYGSDPEFVLAGGGNTSVKVGDRLFVKGSGHALATIPPEGFVELDRKQLEALLNSTLSEERMQREAEFKAATLAARIYPEKNQRPSVEALLHHLMPGQYVVHTHSTLVNMVTCCVKGPELARELAGDVVWIPEVDPGYILSRTLWQALQDYRKATGRDCPRAVLMQNHGLVISGDTPEEIRGHTDWLVADAAARSWSPAGNAPAFGAVTKCAPAAVAQSHPDHRPRSARAAGDRREPEGRHLLRCPGSAWSLSAAPTARASPPPARSRPDQIVYCKSFPLWIEPAADATPGALVDAACARRLRRTRKKTGSAPLGHPGERAGHVRGRRRLRRGRHGAAGLYRCHQGHGRRPAAGGRPLHGRRPAPVHRGLGSRVIPQDDHAASRAAGRMAGKVAIVTGAAQGFGLEISQDLVAQGAHVVLTDVNAKGVQAAAAGINAQLGKPRAIGLAINVTDGASVAEAIYQVVRTFGGFDVLISNAGVLKAGKRQDEAGEGLRVRHRGELQGLLPLRAEGRPDPGHAAPGPEGVFSDIIQINSKSGLEGSNRNGAYAGSKFGGIGLTQSFALELVEDGIKVNAICPGNFFDGPLWSDPKNGLFVQYLRSGKVPGAKTIADVKRFYEAKVPMGRGCTTADVMKAIYYLIEQKYETGQAVPVTGGQVMLS